MDTSKTTITLSRSELADIGMALDLLIETISEGGNDAAHIRRIERKIHRAVQRTWRNQDAAT